MQFAYRLFYQVLPIKKVHSDDTLFILTDEEIQAIKTKEKIAIWLAAIIGAVGVILLYVPQYALPTIFTATPCTIANHHFIIPIASIVYSIALVLIEIVLLTFLNIWCAHAIAVATGFLTQQSKNETEKRNLLINIGLEKKNKQVLQYGINPLQGINKKALLAWNFLFILKATISNMLFKLFVQRVLGRYAIKAVQDFAGIPIFAVWNAYGTKVILKEARVIIMGQNIIEYVCSKIKNNQPSTTAFNELLYDTLQYIAVSKRDFHQNHFILTKHLFELYAIQPKQQHWLAEGYLNKLQMASVGQRKICQLIICIGFILDGKLSINEKQQIKALQQAALLPISTAQIQQYQIDFLQGKGINNLITRFID